MKKQAERFVEIIKNMNVEQQGGLLLLLEGLNILSNKEKSGTQTANLHQ